MAKGSKTTRYQDVPSCANRAIPPAASDALEKTLKETTPALGERVKELACLYAISELSTKHGLSLDETLQRAIEAIPAGWQYPKIACVRLRFGAREFKARGSPGTAWCAAKCLWSQSGGIVVKERRVGELTVCCHEKAPRKNEGPFLKEKRRLLNAICEKLGHLIEQKEMEEEFKEMRDRARIFMDAFPCVAMLLKSGTREIIALNQAAKNAGARLGSTCYESWPKFKKACGFCRAPEAWKTGKSQASHVDAIGTSWEAHWVPVGKDLYFHYVLDVTKAEKAEDELRSQRKALGEKNIALREMISQIESERNRIKQEVAANIDDLIMPLVGRLKASGESKTCVDLLRRNLKSISSSFGRRLSQFSASLTPRELEICCMIKSGLSSKEIAGMLNTSHLTIEKQRKNIRKKLKIAHKDVNLASFLRKL